MAALSIAHTEASLGWGGQEIRILAESRGFLDRGHRVTLYAPPGSRIANEAPRHGVPCVALPIGRKRPAGVLALARAMRSGRHDVVNTHSSTDSWLAAIACCILRDPPVIVRTRHVSVPVSDSVATRWLYRRAAARVVTTGEALRLQLVRDNGLDPARVESIPTGIDAARFGALPRADARRLVGLPADVPVVGIVATLRSWKGHRHLVDALARLADARAILAVVGDGPQRAALDRHVAALGLAPRVRFAGQQRDVAPWLASLDVFALPSTANEGVPQALLQAMFAAVPCVTTAVGAIPEIARDGDTALVVPAGDPDALARAIDRLLADAALGTRLAAAARAFVEPRFGLATMLDRMEAAFRRAIADARR
ncbi:N-acetyl-alpha-D-glucosaminyl L-malate synthase [Burkholderiales bacterium]|nr:N-acetyl-alpha-D-glucosaminyl L-malate synthase [Burkholderiales bacterium]